MRDVYVIRTPENVTFELELAGLCSRALAWVIDLAAMATIVLVVSLAASWLGVFVRDVATALMFVIAFAVQWGYAVVLEAFWGGRTLGKAVAGIVVIDDAGGRLRFNQVVIRNLVRVVDLLPLGYFVGGLSALVRADGRRLGDVAAGTLVVRTRRNPVPLTVVALTERYNSFVNDPSVALAARRISAPERDAMVALSLRRERLPLSIRHRLFGQLATHLETQLGIPRPDFFSDEKYVLNLTAVVLGTSVGYGRAPR